MNGLEALPFLREKSHVVSLVGGGGKTTLLYGMARLRRRGAEGAGLHHHPYPAPQRALRPR